MRSAVRSYSSSVSDPYTILRLPRTATRAEIRDSYYTLAQTHHPDRLPHAHTSKQAAEWNRIVEAYSVLMQRPDLAGTSRKSGHNQPYQPFRPYPDTTHYHAQTHMHRPFFDAHSDPAAWHAERPEEMRVTHVLSMVVLLGIIGLSQYWHFYSMRLAEREKWQKRHQRAMNNLKEAQLGRGQGSDYNLQRLRSLRSQRLVDSRGGDYGSAFDATIDATIDADR